MTHALPAKKGITVGIVKIESLEITGKETNMIHTPIKNKEEAVKLFDEKYWELKNADDFQENGESGIYEFGYKVKIENEIFTITDWGNIKKFIKLVWDEAEKAGIESVNLPEYNHSKCPIKETCIGYQHAESDLENEKEILLSKLTQSEGVKKEL